MNRQGHWRKFLLVLLLALSLVYAVTAYARVLTPSTVLLPAVFNRPATELLKGYVSNCNPMHWQIETTTHLSGANGVTLLQSDLPGGPHSLVYSDAPDGAILGSASVWPTTFIFSTQLVEADWYLWVINGNQQRVSEIVSVHTDSALGLGHCQALGVIFYSPTIPGSTPAVPPTVTAVSP